MNAKDVAQLVQIVVSFRGTIVDVAHLAHVGEVYTVGEAPEARFKLDGGALQNPGVSTLIARTEAGDVIVGLPGFEGVATGTQTRLGSERLTLRCGDLRFDVSRVEAEAAVTGRRPIDRPFWASVIGNASLGALALILMQSIPADGMDIALEDADAAARFASYFHQADMSEDAEPVVDPNEPAKADTKSAPAASTKATSKSRPGPLGGGKAGGQAGSIAAAGPKGVSGLSRHYDPTAAAANAGILGILAAQDQSFLASAEGAFGSSDADTMMWASTEGLAEFGVGSLHLSTSTRPGDGSGVVGLADTGLLGTGTGTQGLTYGNTVGHGDRIAKRVPVAQLEGGKVTNNVDKDVIRRIVRGHINEVRGCYNAGLAQNPNLAGRVTVQFVILGTGKVSTSVIQENTSRDAKLGDCIAKAVKRWKFPAVRGGGTAVVSYPFQLRTR